MAQTSALHYSPNAQAVATAWGTSAKIGSRTIDAPNAKPAGPGWHDYVGRVNMCIANDDTCAAKAVKGEAFCIGHLRQLRKAQEAADEQG